MRVLIVVSRYFPHRGGLETTVHHLALELYRTGHEVLIVASRYPRTLLANEVIDGIPVKRLLFLYPQARFLHERRPDLLLASFWYVWRTTWDLAQIIRHHKPDVVHLQYLASPGFFLWLLQPVLRFAWVVTFHGGDVVGEPYRSRFNAWLFQAVARRADAVTACSQYLADQAICLAPVLLAKMHVIHNGVDPQRFASAAPYRHPKRYIAAIGQLVAHKGFDLLINAFADVAATFPDVDLLIAGEGECRSQLAELVHRHGLADRVYLLGRVDESAVASLMAGSLFVAVPSRREAFGLVALEAMAAGKRVLATPVGGIPEFLPAGINRLVELNQQAWAMALAESLSTKYTDEVNGAGNQNMACNLAWDQIAAHYLQIYAEACSAHRMGKR
jgi:glycogen(starch) synthase